LSAAVAEHLGPVANWCTFATWASKQAGRTIRGEDLQRALEDALRSRSVAADAMNEAATEARRFGSPIGRADASGSLWDILDPSAAFARASAAVARGNLSVFEEIGREFARFDVECGSVPHAAPDVEARFLDGLRPGEPPTGQRLLRQAFSHYLRARVAADPVARAQLVLLANLEIGLHEQTRLQPEIVAALDAAVVDPRDIRDRLIAVLFPNASWLVRLRLSLAGLLGRRSRLDDAIDRIVLEEQRLIHRIVTRHLMSISLGSIGPVRLGVDLGVGFPPSLRTITLADLRDLLDRIDPTRDDPLDSGAVDWSDLDDRIHFIADLFRSFEEAPELFEPPFTALQLDELDAGRRPADPL
ncbi:MAG TPA: hypothetical protein VF119_01175, partial [Candidatus Limnocylindrales bacterium]